MSQPTSELSMISSSSVWEQKPSDIKNMIQKIEYFVST
jgi:hypothetical protein